MISKSRSAVGHWMAVCRLLLWINALWSAKHASSGSLYLIDHASIQFWASLSASTIVLNNPSLERQLTCSTKALSSARNYSSCFVLNHKHKLFCLLIWSYLKDFKKTNQINMSSRIGKRCCPGWGGFHIKCFHLWHFLLCIFNSGDY